MSGMRLLCLGNGDAFSSLYYSTCFALESGERWLLVDCPHPIRKIVREGAAAAKVNFDVSLIDAIESTETAIDRIDRTSKQRFEEAFEAINQGFGETFKQLFGGGGAGIRLVDEDDVLESGIDIIAQPPGKKLQNVLLLSGGEKAMTAIALLFAIFRYRPSPFCLLDEVDAPLDDANVGRFLSMLRELRETTQFIVITHNRKTMEMADQLYGVTMEEPGVSRLVSVSMVEREPAEPVVT